MPSTNCFRTFSMPRVPSSAASVPTRSGGWSVELFFRWFKCILGRRHLLAESQNGVTLQVYVAIIASLLLSLWTGKKPTKRTYEMFCLFFAGWATEQDVLAHLNKLQQAADSG